MSWKITDILQKLRGSAESSASGGQSALTTEASRSCDRELHSEEAGDIGLTTTRPTGVPGY